MTGAQMSLPDVLAFLEVADELQIVPWLAGGWAAEAQGATGRSHDDLDLFVDARDAATLRHQLSLRGFAADTRGPWHVVYRDRHGRVVDVRLFERDGDQLSYGPEQRCPASVLDGYGLLGERAVRVVRDLR